MLVWSGMRRSPLRSSQGDVPLFTAEFSALHRFVRRLKSKGRWGGMLALLIAVTTGFPGAWMLWFFGPWNDEPGWSPAFMVIGGMLGLVALRSAVAGLRYIVMPQPAEAIPDGATFLSALQAATLPVKVCLRCRAILQHPDARECERCLSTDECFLVTSPADLRMVAAALPSDGTLR